MNGNRANGQKRIDVAPVRAPRQAEVDQDAADADQTAADADQTSADSDQIGADEDQIAAERDEADAESDQLASEADQARSDQLLSPNAEGAELEAYEGSAVRREAATIHRPSPAPCPYEDHAGTGSQRRGARRHGQARDETARRRDARAQAIDVPSPLRMLHRRKRSSASALVPQADRARAGQLIVKARGAGPGRSGT